MVFQLEKLVRLLKNFMWVSFSKSTVSKLCLELNEKIDAWNNRSLSNKYPFLIVDGMFV